MQIHDHVFVVTGGGNGIGREVVLALLAGGGRVAAVDLSEAGLKETADLAAAAGAPSDRLTVHVVDITDRDAVLTLPDAVGAAHGQVDGLVNVAGIVHDFAPVAELSFDELERVMAVNFWGTVNTTKAFLPLLAARPRAALINVASMGALLPFPGQSGYGASKAAVKLFTEGLIAEHDGTPLHVGIVFPGAIATDILGNSGVEGHGDLAEAQEAGVSMTTAAEAARQIVEAVEKELPRVRIGKDARLIDRLARLLPARSIPLVARKVKEKLG